METDERRETQNETLATKLNLTRSWSGEGHRNDLQRISTRIVFPKCIFVILYLLLFTTLEKEKIKAAKNMLSFPRRSEIRVYQ